MKKRLDIQRNVLVLQRLDGLRVDHTGPVIGQLDGLAVGNPLQFDRIRKNLRVGIEQTLHILPDGDALRMQRMGENGRAVIRTFAPQGDGELLGRAGNETLRQQQTVKSVGIMILQMFLDMALRFHPINLTLTIMVVGPHQTAGIRPLVRNPQAVQIGRNYPG